MSIGLEVLKLCFGIEYNCHNIYKPSSLFQHTVWLHRARSLDAGKAGGDRDRRHSLSIRGSVLCRWSKDFLTLLTPSIPFIYCICFQLFIFIYSFRCTYPFSIAVFIFPYFSCFDRLLLIPGECFCLLSRHRSIFVGQCFIFNYTVLLIHRKGQTI